MARRSTKWIELFHEFIVPLRIFSKETSSDDPENGSPLELWDSQQRFLNEMAEGLEDGVRNFTCLKSRQLGITTVSLVIDVFWCAMYPGTRAALVSDNESNRDENRSIIEGYIKSFPQGYFGESFKVVKANRSFMQFSNGSRITFLVAGTKKKGVSWAEGKGYSFAHKTEVSKYGDADALKSFDESLAQTNPDRLFITESTANGYNHFRSAWIESKRDTATQRGFFIGWWASNVNRIDKLDRRFTLYGTYPASGEEREKVRAVREQYGHVITPEQLAWIRWKESDQTQDIHMLTQNQPWCVVGDTRVGTDAGLLKINSIIPGLKTSCSEVLRAMPTGISSTWRIKTKLGYEVVGTPNHPVISITGDEIELQHSLDQFIKLQPPRFANDEYVVRWVDGVKECCVRITPDFSRLVGLFMGDGSICGSGSRGGYMLAIACSGRDRDVADECHRLIRSLFGVNTQERHSTPEGKYCGCIDVRTTSRSIFETFKSLGLTKDQGVRARRKIHVPEFIWRSPRHVVREFLTGLFEADASACWKSPQIIFSSKYEEFARDVQLLLLGFGITCVRKPYTAKLNGKVFRSNTLTLRSEEARLFAKEIGFISRRKVAGSIGLAPLKNRKLSALRSLPIAMQDVVTDASPTGNVEQVYNLTVSGDHLFDCNGVLTHNTEQEAFIQSGYSFFQTRVINQDLKYLHECNAVFLQGGDDSEFTYDGYRYELGNDFWAMKLERITRAEDKERIELKIWEEPVPTGKYAIGFDPAYGRNEHKDRSAITVWRCFADRMVQVAEFATSTIEVKHAAWALAHIAGAYRDCIVNVELTGPGRIVMNEWDHLRDQLKSEAYAKFVEQRDWTDALDNARWYLYHRQDQMGAGCAYNFETNWRTKQELMHQLRGAYTTRELRIRSRQLLEEMMNVVQDGSEIGAPESSSEDCKDDRVFATALAVRAWSNWIRRTQVSNDETYERVTQEESGQVTPATRNMNQIVYRFFKNKDEEAEIEPERGPAWKRVRGLI